MESEIGSSDDSVCVIRVFHPVGCVFLSPSLLIYVGSVTLLQSLINAVPLLVYEWSEVILTDQ